MEAMIVHIFTGKIGVLCDINRKRFTEPSKKTIFVPKIKIQHEYFL